MNGEGTSSIVARDAVSGRLGVAAQSHALASGAVVAWARAGTGAVATQALGDPAYGPRSLDALARGRAADQVLAELVAADGWRRRRQVAVIGVTGVPAVHTGAETASCAGDHALADACVQANFAVSARVWDAMAEAWSATTPGNFEHRLLSVLKAGQAVGGDLRGRRSAVLLTVPAEGEPWARIVDLRVDSADDPLAALTALLERSDAEGLVWSADALVREGYVEAALTRYDDATRASPDDAEVLFWAGIGAAAAGDVAVGMTRVRQAIALHQPWRTVLASLAKVGRPEAVAVQRAL